MLAPLTYGVVALAAVLCVVAVYYAIRDRLIDNIVVVLTLAIEVGLLVQMGFGLTGVGMIDDGAERATYIAYLVTLPLIPVGTGFLAIKEKSLWAMGSIAVGAFAVAVMSVLLLQIWNLNA